MDDGVLSGDGGAERVSDLDPGEASGVPVADELSATTDDSLVELGPAGSRGRITMPPVDRDPAPDPAPDDDAPMAEGAVVNVATEITGPIALRAQAAIPAAAAVEHPDLEEEMSLDELDGELEDDLDAAPPAPPLRRPEAPPPRAMVPPVQSPRRPTQPPLLRPGAPPVPPAPPPRSRAVVVVPPLPSRSSSPSTTPPPMEALERTDHEREIEFEAPVSTLDQVPSSSMANAIPMLDITIDDGSLSIDDPGGPIGPGVLTAAAATAVARPVTVPPESSAALAETSIESRLESPNALEQAQAALDDQRWARRADELTAAGERATEREQQAELAYELGELSERHLADEARAVKSYGKALASDPGLRANLWAIRRVFYRRALWPNLVKLIDAELRVVRDDRERADLLIEKALVQADKLGAADDARATLDEALRLDPGAVPALLALERMAAAAGDEVAQAALWDQLAAASELPARKLTYLLDQAALIVASGTTDRRDLARAAELIEQATALELDPDRVAAARLRVAEASGEPEALLTALEAQATLALARCGSAAAPAEGEAAPERATQLRRRVVAIRRRQAQVARAAGAGERAWSYLQAGAALAPGESLLLADLADLAEDLGRYDELAELVQSWQSIESDPRRAQTLSIRRADALLRSGQRETGLALLSSLEAGAPGLAALAALRERDALIQAVGASGDFAPLAAALARVGDDARLGVDVGAGAPAPDPAAALAAYIVAGTLWAYGVGGERGDAQARLALERALEVAPRDAIALEALVEVHERAGRIEDAATALEAAAAHDKRALARLGRLYRSHGRLAEALDVDRRRWTADPTDLALAWRIDATLADLGDDGGRLAHLEALAERDRDPARRGYALITGARLAESQGQGARAVELYRATLAIWPDDGFARGALLASLRRLGRWQELATALRAQADRAGDVDEARRALHEAAWVLENRLGSAEAARTIYRQILDRVPDDAHARAGLARTGLVSGEQAATLTALDAIAADAAAIPALAGPAAIALARAHERAGDTGAALDAYQRAEQVAAPSSVAGPTAALAAWQLALQRGDAGQRVEATRALVGRTADARLIAALHEELGWLFALVNEDFDAAARAFGDSLAAMPDRPGPLLGAALVAARRQDPAALGHAYQRLAATVAMPEAAAALHLRCAAMATAAGDSDGAGFSIGAARAAAPDDVGALVVAAEHTAVAGPPGPDEDGGLAVDRLLGRAEILGMRSALAHDPVARDGWELDRAEALEVAGRLKEAGVAVAGVLRSSPGDRRASEALLRLARRGGDRVTRAAVAADLASQSADLATKLALWSEAATIYDAEGHGGGADTAGADTAAAVAVYRRILVDDPGHAAFDRLGVILRQHDDARGLVDALTARLTWLESRGGADPAIVPILFERAQVRRAARDVRGAAEDLDRVLERAPSHRDALKAQAEVQTALGDPATAADLWRRYLVVEHEGRSRSNAELVLSRLLAEDLGDVGGAIEQLEHVIAAAPSDLGHRERLVGLASHAQDWRKVAREVREIARLRTSPGERARDELRLGQLLRDQLADHAEAIAAFERGRQLDPINLEIIRELAELIGAQRPAQRTAVLERAVEDLRAAIAAEPAVAALHDRLASVFGWRGDRDGQWLALAVVAALATPTAEQQALLATGRAVPAPLSSRQLFDSEGRAALQAPGSGGLLTELWRAASAAVNDSLGVDPTRLGFGRGDRIALKVLGKKYEPAAACLASLGVEDVDVYVSESRPGQARVLAASTPILCLGADVAAGATPMARFLLGRAGWQVADRSAALAELKDAEVAWYLAATLKAAELPVPAALTELIAGDDAAVAERTRMIAKHIARRERKLVAGLGGRLGEIANVAAWRRAVLASGARAGLVFSGDLHVVLEAIDVGRGGRRLATDSIGLDLAAWTVSAAHLSLRRRRGLTIDRATAPGGPR